MKPKFKVGDMVYFKTEGSGYPLCVNNHRFKL